MINGNEGIIIPITTAAAFTANYRLANGFSAVKANLIGKNTIQQVLNQAGCTALRLYYGVDLTGAPQIIIVGVNANGVDLESGIITMANVPCPPICSPGNALNM